MPKIVLFFPKLENESAMLLPASVLMVAAPLVAEGYEVKIIDQRVDEDWREILLEELKNQPLVVGFSVLTGKQILYALEASKLVKENCQAPVVWGGIHPSLLPEQTLQNKNIDFVVIGEGEYTFLKLIKALESKSSYEDIDGLGYKKEGKIFWKEQKDFIDLNSLPRIPYHLINIENYISKISFASGRTGRNIAFYTSRGCPHRCGFCYNQQFNKRRWRGKSAEKVVEEIEELIKCYGITSLEIEDDEFFVDLERVKKICQLIIEKDIQLEIFSSCRVNYMMNMDDDYLNLLKKAGFKKLAFGIESGSPRILNLIHKDITINQVYATIKKLKRVGISSKYYFMVGFPTETIEDIYMTTDLIQKMKELDPGILIPTWRIYTPYPGTDLYSLSIEQGFKPPQNLEEWANYDFNTITTPWITAKLKTIIKNVSFLNKFIALQENKIVGLYGKLVKLYGRIADWRWRNHLFVCLPEKYLISFIIELKRRIKFLCIF